MNPLINGSKHPKKPSHQILKVIPRFFSENLSLGAIFIFGIVLFEIIFGAKRILDLSYSQFGLEFKFG